MDYKKLVEKKNTLDKYRPFAVDLSARLDSWFKIELTYISNSLEGNSLSRYETAAIIEKTLTIGGKSINEHLEVVNHIKALEFIKKQSLRQISTITEQDISNIHKIILHGIDSQNIATYRKIPIRIANSNMILSKPHKIPNLMKKFIAWLITENTLHPVELAASAHYNLIAIYPFANGNEKTARLLMNLILLMKGYPPAIIKEQDKSSYQNFIRKLQLKLIARAINYSFDMCFKIISDNHKLKNDGQLLKIGELAKQVNESNSTIRYWTKKGLLKATQITRSGYQLYAKEVIDRIKKIKILQEQRYSLKEIKKML